MGIVISLITAAVFAEVGIYLFLSSRESSHVYW